MDSDYLILLTSQPHVPIELSSPILPTCVVKVDMHNPSAVVTLLEKHVRDCNGKGLQCRTYEYAARPMACTRYTPESPLPLPLISTCHWHYRHSSRHHCGRYHHSSLSATQMPSWQGQLRPLYIDASLLFLLFSARTQLHVF
jgi:hypothetical protein